MSAYMAVLKEVRIKPENRLVPTLIHSNIVGIKIVLLSKGVI